MIVCLEKLFYQTVVYKKCLRLADAASIYHKILHVKPIGPKSNPCAVLKKDSISCLVSIALTHIDDPSCPTGKVDMTLKISFNIS